MSDSLAPPALSDRKRIALRLDITRAWMLELEKNVRSGLDLGQAFDKVDPDYQSLVNTFLSAAGAKHLAYSGARARAIAAVAIANLEDAILRV